MKPLNMAVLDELQQFIDQRIGDDDGGPEMGGPPAPPGPSLEVEVKPEGMGAKKCPTCGHEM